MMLISVTSTKVSLCSSLLVQYSIPSSAIAVTVEIPVRPTTAQHLLYTVIGTAITLYNFDFMSLRTPDPDVQCTVPQIA